MRGFEEIVTNKDLHFGQNPIQKQNFPMNEKGLNVDVTVIGRDIASITIN